MLVQVGKTGAQFESTTHPGAPASTEPLPALCLVLVYPPELAGQSTVLRPGLVLGRSQEATDLQVAHGTVSRRHAVVERKLGSILCVRDLQSRNGTRVNGLRLSDHPVPLSDQTVVRIGDVLGVVVDNLDACFHPDHALPGRSWKMAAARGILARAAADSAPLLVWGETGTGKERVATEVHRRSGRAGPLLALNCAELSPQLIETQLFGHERGAFTGAVIAKIGLFTAANGGTLFLDEVGELPLELQPKLLRVLQEGEVRPVGSVKSHKVDVRIVAATNRNLRLLALQDSFRRDLLARLSTWELELPPIRERREDLMHWLSVLGVSPPLTFAPNVAEHLLLHQWPDNLRGLERCVHRLATAGVDGAVGFRQASSLLPDLFLTGADDSAGSLSDGSNLPDPPLPSAPPPDNAAAQQAIRHTTVKPTREELLAVYEAHGRSIRATSRHFGKDRRQIYRWFDAYKLAREPNDD